jgi:hypothetical protein
MTDQFSVGDYVVFTDDMHRREGTITEFVDDSHVIVNVQADRGEANLTVSVSDIEG